MVRITRHLRSAAGRLGSTRLSETDREHLGQLVHKALHENEDRLRTRFRPVLAETLRHVGLLAANPPEQAAFSKMVEELLDRISEVGFFTFSDLRDAISRNNLKLPDLVDPVELIRGDPLLRLDRILASSPLDGVYRPSEFYLRLMQRLTAPNFGTRLGRMLTRYVTLPFGTALLVLEGIDLVRREGHRMLGQVYHPLYGPISVLLGLFLPAPPHTQTVAPTFLVTQALGSEPASLGVPMGSTLQQVAAAGVAQSQALASATSPRTPRSAEKRAGPSYLSWRRPCGSCWGCSSSPCCTCRGFGAACTGRRCGRTGPAGASWSNGRSRSSPGRCCGPASKAGPCNWSTAWSSSRSRSTCC